MTPGNPTTQHQVNREWNAMAGEWDDLAGFTALAFKNLLGQHVPLPKNPVVVEFGCRKGTLVERMRDDCRRIVGMDAASEIVQVVSDKIRDREWSNVEALHGTLADPSTFDDKARAILEELEGSVDLVVASSVLTFVPAQDIDATMLKPGGFFCHSDWPKAKEGYDAMNEAPTSALYASAGLSAVSMQILPIPMDGGEHADVFFGVAKN